MTTTVSERNQVIIPPEIAREFDIHPGSKLEWSKTGDGAITVTPMPNRAELARQLFGAGRRWLKPGMNPMAELIHERETDGRVDQLNERG